MKIWFHRYELIPRVMGQARREGALLKIEWAALQFGYSDLHPWPEFGDKPLIEQLASLSELELTPLLERSLEFNAVDRRYRRLGRNAFLGLSLPRAHCLLPDLNVDLAPIRGAGFSHIKVKMGKDLKAETKLFSALVTSTDFIWRVDMNGRLSSKDFTHWWRSLPEGVRRKIDFVEDPVGDGKLELSGPWADDWRRLDQAPIRIIKPARESSDGLRSYRRVIFTHSLDHSLGQACALWTAARFYRKHPHRAEVCGLAAPATYYEDGFDWSTGPRLSPSQGSGFGFTDALHSLSWELL